MNQMIQSESVVAQLRKIIKYMELQAKVSGPKEQHSEVNRAAQKHIKVDLR